MTRLITRPLEFSQTKSRSRVSKLVGKTLQIDNIFLFPTYILNLFIYYPGLSNSRSVEDKEKIVDELFKRYEIEVAKRPEDHGLDFISAYIVMKKA